MAFQIRCINADRPISPSMFESAIVNAKQDPKYPVDEKKLFKRVAGKRKYHVIKSSDPIYRDAGQASIWGAPITRYYWMVPEKGDSFKAERVLLGKIFCGDLVNLILSFLILELNGWVPTGLQATRLWMTGSATDKPHYIVANAAPHGFDKKHYTTMKSEKSQDWFLME